ncbi:MAG TPA: NAD(P)-dependent alcohol dehydrogenase [Candidatus Limnocylindrales bacterium]|nr:NAD(P)-dependent alcohol dehydrogenase [Candidatus Limnocylindrales bacterium]
MRAVVQDRYGPPEVLRVAEVERPEPKAGEVLIRVRASVVSQTDAHIRGGRPAIWHLVAGFRKPRWRSLGVALAGEVEGIGAGVTQFKVGDRVFGAPRWVGAHAEYISVRETSPIALMPEGMTFEEAAAIHDGATQALSALRVADVKRGDRIVIYGASGALGTAAVQIAKHWGVHVTGVCSTAHVELVRSLGADEVVDYKLEDFRKGGPFDSIIDAVGKYVFHRARPALKPGGVYVATDVGAVPIETILVALFGRFFGTRRQKMSGGGRSQADTVLMKELIEAGALRPVIDRTYPMDQVAEAHRYVETWRKAGNVVLTID